MVTESETAQHRERTIELLPNLRWREESQRSTRFSCLYLELRRGTKLVSRSRCNLTSDAPPVVTLQPILMNALLDSSLAHRFSLYLFGN